MVKRVILTVVLFLTAPVACPAAELFGSDYQPCGDAPDTVAIVACLDTKAKAWDRRLNTAYGALQRRIEAGQRDTLRDAQRSWIQYRDANCRFYGSQSGSIRQIQAAECARAMTQERTLELEKAMKFD